MIYVTLPISDMCLRTRLDMRFETDVIFFLNHQNAFYSTTDLSIRVYSILDKELKRYLELKQIYVNDLRKFI